MHGYMTRTIDNNTNINHDISKSWTFGTGMTSQSESYAFAIQEPFVPIIVGALGTIPRCLLDNIDRLGFETSESKKLIRKLQMVSVAGTVKICKTFLRFSQP